MQSFQPFVCIILAVYKPNQQFLEQQLSSIQGQTYTNWHCIIIDDCPDWEHTNKVKELITNAPRFIFSQNKQNLGSYHAFEEGLKLVPEEADLICFSDQDDIWLPNKLERLVRTFQDSQTACVHSDLKLIDENNKVTHQSCWQYEGRNTQIYDPELLILRNTITGCSMMFRREVLKLALPFPKQQIKNSFHHDLWIALMSLQFGRILPVDEPLVLYRQHVNNVVGAKKVSLIDFFIKASSNKGFFTEQQKKFIFQVSFRKELAKSYLERSGNRTEALNVYTKQGFFNLIKLVFHSKKQEYKACRFILYLIIGRLLLLLQPRH